MEIRRATKTDAPVLARLIDLAGQGIPAYFWSLMKESDQSALECGIDQAAMEHGAFSFIHAWVGDMDGEVVSALAGYLQLIDEVIDDLDRMPEFLKPLLELEAAAVDSWYITALATAPDYQCQGIAKRMLDHAQELALSEGTNRMSLVVNSKNTHARAVYEREGFLDYEVRPVVPPPGLQISGDWILMKKDCQH